MKFIVEGNNLKDKRFINRKRKGNKPFVKLDAGDVEKGLEMFNAATSGISEASKNNLKEAITPKDLKVDTIYKYGNSKGNYKYTGTNYGSNMHNKDKSKFDILYKFEVTNPTGINYIDWMNEEEITKYLEEKVIDYATVEKELTNYSTVVAKLKKLRELQLYENLEDSVFIIFALKLISELKE